MAIVSGIFNSVNGDRNYLAEHFAQYFATFIGNGVFPNPSTGLQITANGNMSITLKPGKGWINGYFIINDDNYNLAIERSDGGLNRIDRVVLQLDYFTRTITPVVKKGAFATVPVAPALKRDADAYELAIADVLVSKGMLILNQNNITDMRLNTELCGIVHGVVNQVDTSTIFNQYQSWFNQYSNMKANEFETWFDSVKGLLQGDVAANLSLEINSLRNDFVKHKNDYVAHPGVATTTNTGNAYTVTLNPAPTSYANGMGLILTINADATGAATVKVNTLGVIPVKKANGNAVTNLKKDGVYTLRYSTAQSAFILQGEGGEYGNVIEDDVLIGKTFGTEDGVKTGKAKPNNIPDIVPNLETLYNTGHASQWNHIHKPTMAVGGIFGKSVTNSPDGIFETEVFELSDNGKNYNLLFNRYSNRNIDPGSVRDSFHYDKVTKELWHTEYGTGVFVRIKKCSNTEWLETRYFTSAKPAGEAFSTVQNGFLYTLERAANGNTLLHKLNTNGGLISTATVPLRTNDYNVNGSSSEWIVQLLEGVVLFIRKDLNEYRLYDLSLTLIKTVSINAWYGQEGLLMNYMRNTITDQLTSKYIYSKATGKMAFRSNINNTYGLSVHTMDKSFI